MTAPARPRRVSFALPSRAIPLEAGGVVQAPPIAPFVDPKQTVFLDASLFPPPNSTAINVSANQAITGNGATFTPAGLQFQVPAGNYGVISTIDLLLNGITISSNVTWTLRINGTPAPGYAPLTILARDGAASVSKSWTGPLRILIPVGGFVDWLIQDNDGGSYTAGTSYYGWFWPQARTE